MEKKHSLIGASSAARWFNCPASVRLSKDCPKPPTSFPAAEGTVAHEIAERILKNNLSTEEVEKLILDTSVTYEGHQISVTSEMLEAVMVYVDYVREKQTISATCLFEEKINIPTEITKPEYEAYGTADCIIYEPYQYLEVIDYKHGAGVPVKAENNIQGKYYALGAYIKLKADVPSVTVTIVQPRCPLNEKIQVFTFPVQELMEFRKELEEKIKKCMDPSSKTNQGKWCRWCPASVKCGDLKDLVLEVCDLEEKSPAVVDTNYTDTLSRILTIKDSVKHFLEFCEEQAYHLATRGVPIKGFKIVETQGRSKYTDEKTAEDFLTSNLGDKAFKKVLIGITEAKKELKKIGLDVSNITMRPVKQVLVSDTDERETSRFIGGDIIETINMNEL